MENKKNIQLISASLIIGLSIFGSSLVNKGIWLSPKPKKDNILSLTNGYVDLGKVYKEQFLVDVELTGDDGSKISITGIDPENISDKIDSELNDVAEKANKANSITDPKKMLTGKSITWINDGHHMKVTSYINYISSNFPIQILTLKIDNSDINKGVSIREAVMNKVNYVVKASSDDAKSNFFITKQ